jgi:hypothetical protein
MFKLRKKYIISGIILIILFILPVNTALAAILPSALTELTNTERKLQSLGTLTVNPALTAAAEKKAMDMATKGYFAHTSPEGRTPWYWLEVAGYRYKYAGENLAVNFNNSEDVVQGWMGSPSHQANIVKGNYTEIGTGIATGIYEGREAIFVAQVYGAPLQNTIAKKSPPKPKTIKAKTSAPKKTQKKVTKKTSKKVLGAESIVKPRGPISWQKASACYLP